MLHPADVIRVTLARLEETKRGLESDVFSSPPSDWTGFKERFGRWQQVSDDIALIKSINESEDLDDDKPQPPKRF